MRGWIYIDNMRGCAYVKNVLFSVKFNFNKKILDISTNFSLNRSQQSSLPLDLGESHYCYVYGPNSRALGLYSDCDIE